MGACISAPPAPHFKLRTGPLWRGDLARFIGNRGVMSDRIG